MPSPFYPRKETQCPLDRRLGRPHSPSGSSREDMGLLPPSDSNPGSSSL